MNITDYVVVLMQTPLPTDVIRIVISYVRESLMQYINDRYLERFMLEERMHFRLHELPYPVTSINYVYSYLNRYILQHNLRIRFSHYDYKMDGFQQICFYYYPDADQTY